MPSNQHLIMTGSSPIRTLVKCCGCSEKVAHSESWITKAFGRNGIGLPLPVYVFCVICKNSHDPTEAFMSAHGSLPALEPRVEVDEGGNLIINDRSFRAGQ